MGDYLEMEGLPDARLYPKLMQAFKTSNHVVFERQTHLKQNVKATNQAILKSHFFLWKSTKIISQATLLFHILNESWPACYYDFSWIIICTAKFSLRESLRKNILCWRAVTYQLVSASVNYFKSRSHGHFSSPLP